jgi:hypothetical protein
MSQRILGIDIDEIVKKVLVETFSNEKDTQNTKAEELKDFKAKKQKQEKDENQVSAVDEVEKVSVKASEVVSLFNRMRSGKSLKDKEVRKNFQAYFDSLSGSERLALFSFSKAVADIISGSADEKEAADQEQPEDFGVEVTKSDDKEKKKKTKKVKKDDSSPIVVGEAANKSRELGILRDLK